MTPFDNCAGLFIFSNADGYKLGLTPNLKDSLGKVLPGNLIITRSDCGVGNLDAIENCFVQLSDDDVSLVTKWHSKCERLGAFEYPVPASLPGDESASR